jgi:MYXO-CTERM domain-containing protein
MKWPWGVFAAVALTAGSAAAQDEVEALAEDLEAQLNELDTGDCSVACKALESMIRSAERICELDPGERCAAAREKVAKARARVRAACPECAAAGEQAGIPEPEVEPDEYRVDTKKGAPAPAPPAETGGGCASCTVGERDGGDGALLLLVIGAILLRRRSR